MLRIMVVDDERIEREALKMIIKREIDDAEIVGEAGNGRQAIDIANERKPDLILMDIKMPGIDGVEAVKEIKKRQPRSRFIMISAFNTFEYAKEVMQQGVKEYLLKPSKKQEVVDAILRVKKEIIEERREYNDKQKLEQRFNKALHFMQSEWSISLLVDHVQELDLNEWGELLEIEIKCGYAFVVELKEDTDKEAFLQWLKGFVDEHSPDASLLSPNHDEKLPVFFLTDKIDGNDKNDFKAHILPFIRNLIYHCEQDFRFRPHIGIGMPYDSVHQISKSYYEALHALERMDPDEQVTYLFSTEESAKQNASMLSFQKEKNMLETIKNGDLSSAMQKFEFYLNDLSEDASVDLEKFAFSLNEFFIIATRMINDLGIPIDRFTPFESDVSKQELENKSVQLLRQIVEKIQTWRLVQAKGKLENASEYIRDNYEKSLTLETVANYVDLSPYYLSKLFKEKKGITFIDYLTEIRIEKAKDFMLDPEVSLKEICFKVGYKDPNYFSRVFKKKVGKSPKQFRTVLQP
ncbi:response regulator [Pseudalkalibacillus caeni]|uniref:Response regulator n=1 Tax=Exobacillus caeni TaxID=2574798 RepID=A0A5R9FCY4_9BACL|nr:response regulator [Pseudalkalibacillus caeni]TLS38414.1 response regulator [Pseudalkalibacillus caeni]